MGWRLRFCKPEDSAKTPCSLLRPACHPPERRPALQAQPACGRGPCAVQQREPSGNKKPAAHKGSQRLRGAEQRGEKGKNGVLLITLKQGTPGIVIRRDKEVTENAKVQHNGSLDLTKTIYIDGEKVDLGTKTIDDLIPAENIEGIEVKKEAGGKGEIYITTKKTKAVEKTIAKGNMKVEGKVVDEQGEPIIGAAVLIEGTTTGSVTDVNGNFVLSVPSKDAVLVASYIGMATSKVKAQSKLTITLKNE